ncbi:glycosyltransferase [Nakamurella silvestris]|nr:glycosyltransferase [Nakamurella silvestris]
MTLLVISPDYASHLLPLATIASAWQQAGEEVVVATGTATAELVTSFGFRRTELRLGRGSNPGVIRARDQPPGEDDALRGFFAATRSGMVETLRYQAAARSTDLLWEPVPVGRRVLDVIDEVRPDEIIVDHLAFSARIALDAAQIPYGDVVLGHPSALPVGTEVYGHPPSWPDCFDPDPAELSALLRLCQEVSARFTEQWNAASTALGSTAAEVEDAFALSGDLLLFNYPEQLHPADRTALLPPHRFLGSTVRQEAFDAEVDAWLAAAEEPLVYVSFGSFLSARGDVLATVVDGLRGLARHGCRVRVALATGSADPDGFGEIPDGWLVREYLPQVTILARAAAIVTHAGNNSVTEAAAAGVPMVLLPFSTDQFAGAAAVVAAGTGIALDPNAATGADVTTALLAALDRGVVGRAAELGHLLRASPGPALARRTLSALTGPVG